MFRGFVDLAPLWFFLISNAHELERGLRLHGGAPILRPTPVRVVSDTSRFLHFG